MSMEEAGTKLANSGMPFDQIEITPTHVHVSFDPRMRGVVIRKSDLGTRPSSLLTPPPQRSEPVRPTEAFSWQ
jgi:hypothetical protein